MQGETFVQIICGRQCQERGSFHWIGSFLIGSYFSLTEFFRDVSRTVSGPGRSSSGVVTSADPARSSTPLVTQTHLPLVTHQAVIYVIASIAHPLHLTSQYLLRDLEDVLRISPVVTKESTGENRH